MTDVKVLEAERACQDGAREIDMVINVAKALQGDWDYVKQEIAAVAEACHRHDALLKVIFGTDYITDEADIVRLCEICTEAKADYVKTSTGFGFVKGDDGKYSYTGATIPTLEADEKKHRPEREGESLWRHPHVGRPAGRSGSGLRTLRRHRHRGYFGGGPTKILIAGPAGIIV